MITQYLKWDQVLEVTVFMSIGFGEHLRFQVLSMNGERPAPHLSGWKDTIAVLPKGKTEILVQFNHLADKHYPYMAHCHILEHEDTGMMMQFTVS